jgi:hypothetical protein
MTKIILAAAIALVSPAAMADNVPADATVPQPWSVKDGAVIDYTVLRKGKPFGSHVLTFKKQSDDAFTVTSDVDLDVKLGPISLFKYRLDATETWNNGKLVGLSGKTNNDGDKARVSASADGDMLNVDGTKFEGALPTSIIPSSHWNIRQVYSNRMLSTESGEVLDIEIVKVGTENIKVGSGSVDATHYRLMSDINVDLWYDNQSRWVKLKFEVDGQNIEYVLNELY